MKNNKSKIYSHYFTSKHEPSQIENYLHTITIKPQHKTECIKKKNPNKNHHTYNAKHQPLDHSTALLRQKPSKSPRPKTEPPKSAKPSQKPPTPPPPSTAPRRFNTRPRACADQPLQCRSASSSDQWLARLLRDHFYCLQSALASASGGAVDSRRGTSVKVILQSASVLLIPFCVVGCKGYSCDMTVFIIYVYLF